MIGTQERDMLSKMYTTTPTHTHTHTHAHIYICIYVCNRT